MDETTPLLFPAHGEDPDDRSASIFLGTAVAILAATVAILAVALR